MAQLSPSPGTGRFRLDKWLWAARFYKTRSLAAQAIEAGQVKVDDERVKPAHAVKVGAMVVIRKQSLSWIVEVVALSDHRGGAPDAAKLYKETGESIRVREEAIAARKAALANAPVISGRPTKRQRRKLQEFLDEA
jgi:ribosome-associated heat shock protein Hsp15